MASITCCTCKSSFSIDEIPKHLSSTRHKLVEYEPLKEVIECEDCDNTNIHQLLILRFGLTDMTLLCDTCLSKEDKPSVNYSLSNGSFFKKIEQYYKFRDLECNVCSSDRQLYVGNTKTNQYIVCRKCLAEFKENYPDVKFTSADDDFFLSELFGLTEFTPKRGGKSKGRAKAMRGGKKRQLTPQKEKEAEERREHYFNKLHESKQLKSGTIVKAVGTEKPNKDSKKGPQNRNSKSQTPSRSSTPIGNSKASRKPTSKQSEFSNGKTSSRAEPVKKPSNGTKRATKDIPSGSGSNGKPEQGPNSRNLKATTGNDIKSGNSGKVTLQKDSKPNGANPEKSFKRNNEAPLPVRAKADKKTGIPSSKSNDRSSTAKNTKKGDSAGNRETRAPKNEKKNSKEKNSQNSKEKLDLDKLPVGIESYTPSPQAKLTYESIDEYYKEMSYNLFLEEKLSIPSSNNSFISSDSFVLSWYAEQDKKNKLFHVEIDLTQEFKDRFLSKKIQKFKKIPFSVDQGMFLVCNEKVPWYGKVALAEVIKKGRNKEILEMVVELYPWNFQRLPTSTNIKHLSLLPVSIPVSRVFLAMSRIDNPKFKKMLLGKEPIKQISFRNYIKLSDERKFNDSQKVALQSVLNNSITVLQGPPGTGKTSTIHEVILQLLNNLNTYPILVVAASNIAIDNIAEKLLPTHGMSLLRIVSNEKEPDYNRDHYLSSICMHHKLYDMLPMSMRETIVKLRGPRAGEVSVNQFKKLRSEQFRLSNLLTAQARVIFTTSIAAGGNQLKSVSKFPVVIMDEATQSSEPTTLVPLSMTGVEKFVFVGDHKQLSSFTQVPSLSLSLFERVLLNGTYTSPHMLDTQYRMHPTISEFPRHKFYNNMLKDGITEEQRRIELIPKAVQFWDTKGTCRESRVSIRMREDNGYTYDNKGEINYIVEVLNKLIFEKKIDKANIGIITPYRGQRDLISKKLSANELINPERGDVKIEIDRDDIYNESKPVTIHMVSDIMIASIDAFQGREKDFIIFSCVRSNVDNKIGFLNDERRLNVALTRARYGLILVGDYDCLQSDGLWKEYLTHLSDKELVNRTDNFTF